MTSKELRQYYNSESFEKKYYYTGPDLGAFCGEKGTVFKLWSPLAAQVILNLYPDGGKSAAIKSLEMKQEAHGVWSFETPENLDGIYYDYRIQRENETVQTGDPYARACGVNGKRSMVIDLKKTNPAGWEKDTAPERETEDIIYELHVKEFSWDKSAGVPEEYRGRYKAFTCTDTTLWGDDIHPTGIAYLKELGVNHIQLMPVYDYGSVDEAGARNQFNWGYDPVNYNVPEGSYATDAVHGQVRIIELKELVMSLHQQGFRVIMDVVYNHTYDLNSHLQKTVPWYYYRQNEDGTPSNGSACDNDIASERRMCAKYILDSVLYWAGEYHMDGFRFDLMGLLDVGLMNRIQEALDETYGVGEKLIYGEPWAAADSPMKPGHVPALKKNIKLLHENVGIFCDSTRDAIKGHVFEEKMPGFVNGGKNQEKKILHAVTAWCEENDDFQAKAPSQIITYISAHDNLTLWDKLVRTMSRKNCWEEYPEGIVKAYKLAAAVYFTCQGRLFLLSGEEFARTKEGNENSYNAPVELNRLDWERAYRREDILEYYKGLIQLRKQLPGLCDKSADAKKRITGKKLETKGCASFSVDNRGKNGESPWKTLFVIYNAGKEKQKIKLPQGTFTILVDGESSTRWKEKKQIEKTVDILPKTAMILGQE